MKKIETGELVIVTWKDAITCTSNEDLLEMTDHELMEVETIGYLLAKNDERVAVSGFVFIDGGDLHSSRYTHYIPTKTITKITKLKRVK